MHESQLLKPAYAMSLRGYLQACAQDTSPRQERLSLNASHIVAQRFPRLLVKIEEEAIVQVSGHFVGDTNKAGLQSDEYE